MEKSRKIKSIEERKYQKNNKLLFFWCVLVSLGFLAICSKSSFLYPINDWVDSNCFFTMGKALMNGRVLYRDIYEQKGPLLYFVHGLAYLFSNDSFIGVYIIEALSFSLFLFFSIKSAELYLKRYDLLLLMAPILSFMILTSKSFSHGDSVEELSLVFVIYGLYSVLNSIKKGKSLQKKEALFNGIGAASMLWMKYTLVGFYIGLIIVILFMYISKKEFKELFTIIQYFLLGFFIITIPIFIYFLINDSLEDLLRSYFYNNIFLYQVENTSVPLNNTFELLIRLVQDNLIFSIIMISGVFWSFTQEFKEFLIITLSFLSLVMTVYIGGRYYVYYGLILSPYAVFGIIAFLSEIEKNKRLLIVKKYQPFLLIISFLFFIVLSYINSSNVYLMQVTPQEMPQYKFAEKMKEKNNPKILNYGFLDGGFYTAANAMPEFKYFCTLNIPLPDMHEEQKSYIENEQADFVITRGKELSEYKLKSSGYKKIDESSFFFSYKTWTYYLYTKIE